MTDTMQRTRRMTRTSSDGSTTTRLENGTGIRTAPDGTTTVTFWGQAAELQAGDRWICVAWTYIVTAVADYPNPDNDPRVQGKLCPIVVDCFDGIGPFGPTDPAKLVRIQRVLSAES